MRSFVNAGRYTPMITRRHASLALALAALALPLGPAQAQEKFPSRTIRIVVPFPAGGGVDVLARLLAERMQTSMGANVIVENRAGGSGTVGGSHVMQSAPDGYTVLISSNTHTMSKLALKSAPYDPLADFTPIARVGEAPLLTILATKLPQNTLKEVAEAARKNPDQWTAGVPALGSPGHMAALTFNHLTKANITIAPYRGTAPALNDVAGGHLPMMTDAMVVLLPQAKAGKVKALAITSTKRSALAPDIPTATESGVPVQVTAWYGLWGPKSMPADVVKALNGAANQALKELSDSGRLAQFGIEATAASPEEFAKFQAAEVARNGELLRAANFKPE
jgi:tripartite-type tricarboxylate transporter receptor subunit TctC